MKRHGQDARFQGMVVDVVLGAIAQKTPTFRSQTADDPGRIRLDGSHRFPGLLRLYRRTQRMSQDRARRQLRRAAKVSLAANGPPARRRSSGPIDATGIAASLGVVGVDVAHISVGE